MTEENKKQRENLTVELKPEDRELLKSVIEAQKPKKDEHKGHEHLTAEAVTKFFAEQECPDGICAKENKKLSKHYVREFLKDRKNLKFECEECGTPVKEEDEECPTCSGKNARRK